MRHDFEQRDTDKRGKINFVCRNCNYAICIAPKDVESVKARLPSCEETMKAAKERLRSLPQLDLRPAAERLGIALEQAGCYARALVRWTLAGFPMREQGEVDRIEAICRHTCDHYEEGHCSKCGCKVNKSKIAVVNKAKMKTETCPIGRW